MGTLTGPSLAAAAAVVMGRAVTLMLPLQAWKLARQATVEVSRSGGGLNSNAGQSWVCVGVACSLCTEEERG